MKRITRIVLVGMLSVMYMDSAVSKAIEKIEARGIYVVAKHGYVKVEPYSHDDSFVDFRYLNEVPSVERDSDELKIIVYEKGFSEGDVRIGLRPVDVVVKVDTVKYTVKSLSLEDMYEVTLDIAVADGAMLHVYSGYYDNMGVVMLGETQDVLENYFSNKKLSNSSAVEQYLSDALVAFPGNDRLKKLRTYWKKAADDEKDNGDYAYVNEQWQKYEQAEKLTLKSRYLERAIVEINGYLNAHPDGRYTAEAKSRKVEAEKMLKEYERML